MKKSDFNFEQFTYGNGEFTAAIDEVVEDPHYQLWQIHYDPIVDQVTLRSTQGEVREPDREFLHTCTKPDAGKVIPSFPN